MPWFLGIDAGGTHTRALVVHGESGQVGHGSAGPGNLRAQPLEQTLRSLELAMASALGAAGLHARELGGACLGLAGLRTEADAERLRAGLAPFGLGGALVLTNDLAIAHRGSLEGEAGVHLIAGTGAAAYGRNAAGEEARAGGWGWRIDDGGSAYWLGIRALEQAVRQADGRAPRGGLLTALLDLWEVREPDALLPLVYDADPLRARERIAGLAKLVCALAEVGDEPSGQILDAGAEELARMAQSVARRLGLDAWKCPVAITGGVGEAPAYAPRLALALRRFLPVAALRSAAYRPLAGAVLTAVDAAGEPVTPGLLKALHTV